MILFLVSASVPIDMRAPSDPRQGFCRCAARRGLSTRALWIRGRSTAGVRVWYYVTRKGNPPRLSAHPTGPEIRDTGPAVPWGSDSDGRRRRRVGLGAALGGGLPALGVGGGRHRRVPTPRVELDRGQ